MAQQMAQTTAPMTTSAAQPVGDMNESSKPWLKWVIIAAVVIILGVGAYYLFLA